MPVRREARAGTHTGEAEYARSYRTPFAASASMFGVRANDAP
jgi:hypothetical protein